MNNFYIKTALIFCAALLFISIYYILFSIAIGGDWRLYGNLGDFVNMASFAFIATALVTVLFWTGGAGRNVPFVAALGILTIIMTVVVSINRYLAVYPASGAESLFLLVGVLDLVAVVTLPVGLNHVVQQLTKKHTYD